MLVIGRDRLDPQSQSLLTELQIEDSVVLEGSVANERMLQYYAGAHFLLQSSRYESQGMVFNEAMATGTVIVTTRVGLAADLGDDYCITSPPGDHRALASAALEIIADVERLAALRRNAMEWSSAHDAKWTAGQYAEIYRGLVAKARLE